MSKNKGKKYEKQRGISLESIKQVTPFLMIFFIVFVISGGLYVIIEVGNPSPDETIGDFLFVFLMNGMMVLGLVSCYNSSKIMYHRGKGRTLLAIGIILFLLSWLGMNYFDDSKGGVNNIFYYLRTFFKTL
jgi:hypothetical protein